MELLTGLLLGYGMNVVGAVVTLMAQWLGREISRAARKSDKIAPSCKTCRAWWHGLQCWVLLG